MDNRSIWKKFDVFPNYISMIIKIYLLDTDEKKVFLQYIGDYLRFL